MKDFKVSICMITYNHEKFIGQAIDGVLMQKTTFDFRLVIGEDCSTDNTRQICTDYKNKYPEKIILRLPEKNLGSLPNFVENLKICSKDFKYVAMCEGDDYWIDEYKLQKQVDYLEENADCGLVYTDIKIFDEHKNIFIERLPKYFLDFKQVVVELLKTKYIELPSIVVKTDLLIEIMKVLEPEFSGKIIGDTRLILEFAQRSLIGYLPHQTTVYRIVSGSASHPKEIHQLIFASKDTYLCRKTFVIRHKLNKRLLGIPVCNLNRGLVFHAYNQTNYFKSLQILSNINIADMINFCDFKTFKSKIDLKICLKFLLSFTAISSIKNSIKKI